MSLTDYEPWVERNFSRLRPRTNFEVASRDDEDYNCIAFAASDVENWWQPRIAGARGAFWPPGVPNEMTLSAFIAAFRTLGYELCDNGIPERRTEKIALYTKNGVPRHAARQVIGSSAWLSKLGNGCDIRHRDVDGVGGGDYGEVACYMSRPVSLLKPLHSPVLSTNPSTI